MLGTSISMHWHGLHQKGTPFMDGVPYITQCPIDFGNTFRYRFMARKPGSFLYHSHAGNTKRFNYKNMKKIEILL
jgi:L-ascorbate oxidase